MDDKPISFCIKRSNFAYDWEPKRFGGMLAIFNDTSETGFCKLHK